MDLPFAGRETLPAIDPFWAIRSSSTSTLSSGRLDCPEQPQWWESTLVEAADLRWCLIVRTEVPAVHKLKIKVYGVISRNAIFPRSRRKKNRRSTGLPGKLPVNRLVTIVVPSRCSKANGSLV